MRYPIALIAPLALTALLWSVAGAADSEPAAKEAAVTVIHAGTQTHCPVGGGEIDKGVHEDHQGQRVYFCCPGCEETFLNDAEKHFQAIGAKGQTVASIQTVCPVAGNPVDTEVHVDHAGRRVFFCCPDCRPAFDAEPDAYLPILR
jgi:YHS domain-containing protein